MTTMAATAGVSRRYSSTRLLLDRQRNRTRNLELLSAAGCSRHFSAVRCERCGITEPVYCWTPVRRRGHTLHLRCPSGCQTRVRYELARDRVTRERDWIDIRPRLPFLTVLGIAVALTLLIGTAERRPPPADEEVIGAAVDTNQRSVPPAHTRTSGSGSSSGDARRPPVSGAVGDLERKLNQMLDTVVDPDVAGRRQGVAAI